MNRTGFRRKMALCAMAAGVFGSVPASAVGPMGAAATASAVARTGASDGRFAAVRALLRSGDHARAESVARTLLAEAESSSGKDSLDAARAIDLVVASLVRAGKARAPEAGELARRAVAIKEKALG